MSKNENVGRDFEEKARKKAARYEEEMGSDKNDTDDIYESESNSCYSQFIKGMRIFWATKHTEDTENNRELFISTTIRELVIYILFLLFLMIIIFGMTNGLSYYYTNLLNGLFLSTPFNNSQTTYTSAASVEDYWNFLTGPLMSGLYWNQWYNSMPTPTSDNNFIFYENKLIGVPRLRQVRVRNDSCAIPADFQNDLKLCYADYSLSVESSDPFGLANSTAWNYTSQTNLSSQTSQGSLTKYGGGGYYVDLNQTQSDTLNTLNFLFNNYWIDRGTRAVILDFTVYNANINLFCVIKLVTEFPACGGIIPNSEFRTVKLLRYVTSMDYFVMICELIFIVFLIYYIVEEAIEIKKHRLAYFFSFWNCLDILVIGANLMCVVMNILRSIYVQKLLQNLLANSTQYPNFDFLSSWQTQFDYSISLTLFFAWIKVFKYISFNKTMSQLSLTLGCCATDLAGFSAMFFVIFVGFAQLGYLIFGAQCQEFRSFKYAVFILLRLVLGDFDFTQIESANRILAPIYFTLYIFFVFFVLLNMFMAIINDTYSGVKADIAKKDDEFQMADYFRQRANLMMAKLNFKRDQINDLQSAIGAADSNNDDKLDFDEWKAELKKRGYADAEIESVFSRYDTDGDRVLDASERRKMQLELENQKASINNEIKKTETDSAMENSMGTENLPMVKSMVDIEEYLNLTERVEGIESTIEINITKIERVLKNLGEIENKRSKRHKVLGLILETLSSNNDLTNEERRIKLESIVTEEMRKMNIESAPVKPSTSSKKSGHQKKGEK